jgi:hypothetical protein
MEKRINIDDKKLMTSPMIPKTFDLSKMTAMILVTRASGEPMRKENPTRAPRGLPHPGRIINNNAIPSQGSNDSTKPILPMVALLAFCIDSTLVKDWPRNNFSPREEKCHPERSEGSGIDQGRSFASLRMTSLVRHFDCNRPAMDRQQIGRLKLRPCKVCAVNCLRLDAALFNMNGIIF